MNFFGKIYFPAFPIYFHGTRVIEPVLVIKSDGSVRMDDGAGEEGPARKMAASFDPVALFSDIGTQQVSMSSCSGKNEFLSRGYYDSADRKSVV